MLRSLFGNSNRKLRSTFWGSPFIPVGTNQTKCCLPLTNFLISSFTVPDSRYTNSPFFWIQTVTEVAFTRLTGKSLTIMLSTPQMVSTPGIYRKASISPRGLIYFKHIWGEGGLIETGLIWEGGFFKERRWYQSSINNYNTKWKSLSIRNWRSFNQGSKKQIRIYRARSIQPKFRPVRPGKVDHLKRWTCFSETFPVGPNRSIGFWAEISGNFGWMDRAHS